MAIDNAELEGEELSAKEKKKRDKAAKKAAKAEGFSNDTDASGLYDDADDDGFSFSVVVIIAFIVLIWIAILCLLVKLDIGGFGSGVLYPVLKDVPGVNKILPEVVDEETYQGEFDNLPDALAEIKRLNLQIDDMKKELEKGQEEGDSEEVKSLKEEITRLRTFEDSQIQFEKLKTEFYEEVVFSDNAPEPDNYKKYYESIDPDNAEYLYKQVVTQLQEDKQMDEYVKAYSEMKPKQAAKIFEMMTDNLDLVATILGRMEPTARAKILGVMDADIASKITKIMDPE